MVMVVVVVVSTSYLTSSATKHTKHQEHGHPPWLWLCDESAWVVEHAPAHTAAAIVSTIASRTCSGGEPPATPDMCRHSCSSPCAASGLHAGASPHRTLSPAPSAPVRPAKPSPNPAATRVVCCGGGSWTAQQPPTLPHNAGSQAIRLGGRAHTEGTAAQVRPAKPARPPGRSRAGGGALTPALPPCGAAIVAAAAVTAAAGGGSGGGGMLPPTI